MTRSRFLRLLLALVVGAVAIAAGVHGFALSEYRASFGAGPTASRYDAIGRATKAEPWNRTFAAREAYVHAEVLLAKGDLEGGYQLLHRSVNRWPDDKDLDRLYRKVYPEWYEWSSLKAHVQHGHEGPGGTLRPEDIER
jgi:hypothetical protein